MTKGRWALVIVTIVAFGLAIGYSAWRGPAQPEQEPAPTNQMQTKQQYGTETRSVTDKGITLSFATPQFDGVRLTLPYSIQADRDLTEPVTLDNAQVKLNMQAFSGSTVSRRQPTSGRNAAGELIIYPTDDVADYFRLDVSVSKLNEVEGNWNFQLNGQLTSKPINLTPNIQKKKGDLRFTVSSARIGQGAGVVRYKSVAPATADHLQINGVELQDEQGRQLQTLLTSTWNGNTDAAQFTQVFQLYDNPPKQLLLKPYYYEGQGEMTPKHEILLTTPWDGKTTPTKINLGESKSASSSAGAGESRNASPSAAARPVTELTRVEPLPDRTRLTFQVTAEDPFLDVNLIRLFDAEDHEYLPLDSFAQPTEVKNGVYTFTREYPRLPLDKAFTFKTSTHDRPVRKYLPELEVRIPLD